MLKTFEYNTPLNHFVIIAGLKHGTRFLEKTRYSMYLQLQRKGNTHSIKESLIDFLYDSSKNPVSKSSIKILKTTKTKTLNDYGKIFFVYRDPLDTFKSAIITGASNKVKDEYEWDNTNLNLLMSYNNHFYYHLWRDIKAALDECKDDSSIRFVSLDDLSDLIIMETLEGYTFEKKEYSFDNSIKSKMSKEELLNACETEYPTLWNKYLEQIKLERDALFYLVKKYNWK
jgi:hypothetical protein